MCSGLSGAKSKAMPMVELRGVGFCGVIVVRRGVIFVSGANFKCGRCSEIFYIEDSLPRIASPML